jgi:hypothetical protein
MITSAATAMHTTVSAPAIRRLACRHLNPGDRILLYGAGHGRNADWLRQDGYRVYAYDPYNGDDSNGWYGVSDKLPSVRFTAIITCYVLNVVNPETEAFIRRDCLRRLTSDGRIFHIVRGEGDMTKAAGSIERAIEGYTTSRGYQRLVNTNGTIMFQNASYICWEEK